MNMIVLGGIAKLFMLEGLIVGPFPAVKASRMEATEALRHSL